MGWQTSDPAFQGFKVHIASGRRLIYVKCMQTICRNTTHKTTKTETIQEARDWAIEHKMRWHLQ